MTTAFKRSTQSMALSSASVNPRKGETARQSEIDSELLSIAGSSQLVAVFRYFEENLFQP